MKLLNSYTIISLIFLMLFLSYLPGLFRIPLKMSLGVETLAKELINSQEKFENDQQDKNIQISEMERKILKSYRVLFLLKSIFISLGIYTGLLLLFRKKAGRYLAIAISFYGLSQWLFNQLSKGNIIDRLIAKFTILLKVYPLEVIHRDIISNLIYLAVIIFLLRPSISNEFNNHKTRSLLKT